MTTDKWIYFPKFMDILVFYVLKGNTTMTITANETKFSWASVFLVTKLLEKYKLIEIKRETAKKLQIVPTPEGTIMAEHIIQIKLALQKVKDEENIIVKKEKTINVLKDGENNVSS